MPAEIEPVILRHPAVREVAIVPLPDDRLGERACAAIIARDGHAAPTLAELQEFLDGRGRGQVHLAGVRRGLRRSSRARRR